MKLYTARFAMSPRRVELYLDEKPLPIERVVLDTAALRTPEFRAKNPRGLVPVLQLDDGRTLAESDAIIEYLEELHPEPPLLGADAWQRARTREAERVVELSLLLPLYTIFHHTDPSWAARHEQAPAVVPSQRQRFAEALDLVDGWLGARAFIAGDAFTLADLTLLLAVDSAPFVGLPLDDEPRPDLQR